MRRFLPLSLALFSVASMLAAQAAPPGFAEGVRAYQGRQYRQALSYFSQAVAKAPTDPTIHYYMGLSYQGMNQMTLAKQEYSYVAANRANRQLAAQASVALANLGRYSTTSGGTQLVASSGSSGGGGGSIALAGGNPEVKLNGRLKILYFHTDW